jgi:hypothetical protein
MIAVCRGSKTHEAERKLEHAKVSCSSRRAGARGNLPKTSDLAQHAVMAGKQRRSRTQCGTKYDSRVSWK